MNHNIFRTSVRKYFENYYSFYGIFSLVTRRIILLVFVLLFTVTCLLSAVYAAPSLDSINQKVCDRFEEDVSRLAAIMEEVRRREGITETRVAFGGSDTPIKNADYWVTNVAEAIAFQRNQKSPSVFQLKSSLLGLRNKVLNAKTQVGKALEE